MKKQMPIKPEKTPQQLVFDFEKKTISECKRVEGKVISITKGIRDLKNKERDSLINYVINNTRSF